MPVTPERFVSGSEAAKFFGVSKGTITNWVRSGRLTPSGRLYGRYLMFDPDHLNEVLLSDAIRQANERLERSGHVPLAS